MQYLYLQYTKGQWEPRAKRTCFMNPYIPHGCAQTIWLCLCQKKKVTPLCETIPTTTNHPQHRFLFSLCSVLPPPVKLQVNAHKVALNNDQLIVWVPGMSFLIDFFFTNNIFFWFLASQNDTLPMQHCVNTSASQPQPQPQ